MNSIASNAFLNCRELTSIILSDNITKIGKEAFSNCKELKKLTLSNHVTEIGSSAISGCDKLKDITMPRSMKEIQYNFGSFYGGTELKNLNITMKKGKKLSFVVTLGDGNRKYRPEVIYKNKKRIVRKGNI